MIKGGEVGEVRELTRADRMQDRTLDLCVQSVVAQWCCSQPVMDLGEGK